MGQEVCCDFAVVPFILVVFQVKLLDQPEFVQALHGVLHRADVQLCLRLQLGSGATGCACCVQN